MARLYERTAKKDIWLIGFRTPADNKQGYKRDRSIPGSTSDHEEQDKRLVKKGQQYYTWHPKGSDWQYSLKRPDMRSAWDKEYADYEDRTNEACDSDEEARDEMRTELEEKKQELEDSLERMPEQLQESSILNERIEQMQELLDNLDNS